MRALLLHKESFFHLCLSLLLVCFFLYIYKRQCLVFVFFLGASIEDDKLLSSFLWPFIEDNNELIIIFFFPPKLLKIEDNNKPTFVVVFFFLVHL
jgi:hypothetical protein